jgi:tape measure domain-containing protein
MEGAREGVRDVLREQQGLTGAQEKGAESVERMGRGYRGIAGVVRSLVAGFSVVQAARVADEWASVEGRVSLATKSVDEQKYALQEIYGIAQRTRQEYTATGDLFQKVQRNASDLGLGLSDSLNLTEIIGKTMTIGGGSTGAQQAALMQLGQALGAGALRGDELNSIIEQAPRLAQAIAEAFGVSVGQLKDLGKAGKLTSKELAQGLLKQADKIGVEFERMPKTFGGSMVILKNVLGRQINALNKATGAANAFAAAAAWVAENLTDVLKVLGLIAASTALTQMRMQLLQATKATTLLQAAMVKLRALSLRALWPFLRMAALLATIYLIGQDIWVWLQGGDSVMGDLIGPAEKWRDTLDSIKGKIEWIKNKLGGIGQEMGPWLAKWGTIGILLLGLSTPLLSIVKLAFSFGKAIFWVVRGVAMLVSGLAAIVGWPAVLIAAAIAALIALGVYVYKHWQDIKKWAEEAWASAKKSMGEFYDQAIAWIKGIGQAITTWISDKLASIPIPDWVKDAGAWVGNKVFGAGAADVQRVAPAGGVTIQNNIGGVQVTAPNSSPAAIAAATERGIRTAVSPGRMSRAAAALPMVEAGA